MMKLADSMLHTCIGSANYLLEYPAVEIFLKGTTSPNPRKAMLFEAMLLTYGMILNQMYQKLSSKRMSEFQSEIWIKFRKYIETNRLEEGLKGNFEEFCNSRFELNHHQIGEYLNRPVGTYSPKEILYNIFQSPLNQSNGKCKNIEIEKYFINRTSGLLNIIMNGINKSL